MYGCSMGGVFLLVSMIPIKHLLLLTESSFVDNGDGIVGEIKMANVSQDDAWGGTSIFYDRNNGQMRFLFKYHHGD